jgi:hypothetical protein
MTIMSPEDLARLIEKQEHKGKPLQPERLTHLPTAADLLGIQLREAGLHYETEFLFHPTRKWRADYAVRRRSGPPLLLVEVEGGSMMNGRHNRALGFENDCEKYAEALMLGYAVLRVTSRQVRNMKAIRWIIKLTESET